MKYQVEENCLTVFLPEEVDHHNTEELRIKTDRLIEDHQIKCVIFDFADTNFMDSSGIGFVMGRYRLVNSYGGRVDVIGLSERLYLMMKLAGLENLVKLEKKQEKGKKNETVK